MSITRKMLKGMGLTEDQQISTHAPARGATLALRKHTFAAEFLLTPLREGRRRRKHNGANAIYFYSRPCERGDGAARYADPAGIYFYSRPCERGDLKIEKRQNQEVLFLLTPLREGRRGNAGKLRPYAYNFYSRPCERGDPVYGRAGRQEEHFYSRPCERGDLMRQASNP